MLYIYHRAAKAAGMSRMKGWPVAVKVRPTANMVTSVKSYKFIIKSYHTDTKTIISSGVYDFMTGGSAEHTVHGEHAQPHAHHAQPRSDEEAAPDADEIYGIAANIQIPSKVIDTHTRIAIGSAI